MKRKAVSMLLMGALAFCLFGCREKEPGAVGEANAPTTRERETAREGTTARPARPAQPTAPAQPTQPGQPGTAQDTLMQQKNEYVQGAEQILNNMEQKFTAWQQQAGAGTAGSQDTGTQQASPDADCGCATGRR